MIEVETPQEIEVISNGIDVEARTLDVEVVDLKELDIAVAKREFVITGDDIYVPKLYDDAPQWMKDLVQLVVNSAMDTGNASTLAQLTSMLSQFATSYVPLNQYTQSILDLSNEDANIHSVIETLNSNYNNGLSQANAQIISLQNTKASKDEVVTQVVDTLAAQLANPTSSLGAAIGNLQQTIVSNQNANALSMQTLTASLEDVSGDVSSNATVVNNALAYVGINSAGASTGTGLSAYVQGSNGVIGGADSKVANNVYVDAQGNNYSKWAYNSTVSLNGVNYNSGFGLSNSTGTGIGSEFWINADKLKFTNNGKTGSKAPFTIDASGSTPQVEFNGRVSFGSIYDQTIIQNGYINTGLIQANTINASMINTTGLIAEDISTTTLNGKIINGARINGAVIKASYLDLDGDLEVLTNYHLCTSTSQLNAILSAGGTGRLVLDADKLTHGGDAVYITADDEWRIPSISTAREVTKSTLVSTTGAVINGTLYSYTTTSSGTNNKAVKRSPVFTNVNNFTLINAYATSKHYGVVNYINSNHFRVKLGNTTLFECRMWWESNAGQWDGNLQLVRVQYSGAFFSTITHTHNAYYTGGPGAASITDTVDIGIGSLQLTWSYNTEVYTTPTTVVGVLLPGTVQYPANWDEGCLQLEAVTMYQGYNPFENPTNDTSKVTFSTSTGLYINNMI